MQSLGDLSCGLVWASCSRSPGSKAEEGCERCWRPGAVAASTPRWLRCVVQRVKQFKLPAALGGDRFSSSRQRAKPRGAAAPATPSHREPRASLSPGERTELNHPPRFLQPGAFPLPCLESAGGPGEEQVLGGPEVLCYIWRGKISRRSPERPGEGFEMTVRLPSAEVWGEEKVPATATETLGRAHRQARSGTAASPGDAPAAFAASSPLPDSRTGAPGGRTRCFFLARNRQSCLDVCRKMLLTIAEGKVRGWERRREQGASGERTRSLQSFGRCWRRHRCICSVHICFQLVPEQHRGKINSSG
ncbi:uncharacterized protein LOC142364964 [Opisthocomus hoazin]|uniref:uncharacterized protein LOC142364964 n=1 Tax=Opisthocomus hoazin TaxID=30419 RepID=UPI003F52FF03